MVKNNPHCFEWLIENEIFKSGIILKESSLHGVSHWRRVEQIGIRLASETGADPKVVSLFAYLHDARRYTDDDDPEHGSRAAELLCELVSTGAIEISDEQFNKLIFALTHHPDTFAQSDDPTVHTCWDADRLDLWRDMIVPDPQYLFTPAAKEDHMIEWARILNFEFEL